jgi:hypothetical protein
LADSVAGSKDHVKVQGEILEGLVARIVARESSAQMQEVLRNFPQPPIDGGKLLNLNPILYLIVKSRLINKKFWFRLFQENVCMHMGLF